MSRAAVFADGKLVMGRLVCRAALGRAGITPHKQEGDSATPAGLLPLRKILYRADRLARPASVLPTEPIAPEDGWCDDPAHRDYNRQIRTPHEARHEQLWRRDAIYDLIAVLGWNDAPVQRKAGSAIFLHVARPDFAPTEGCIALALPDLLTLLAAGVTEIEVLAQA
jgi:L,D-peptidoglycan transpeptidase YkuD (ErfK/YbiS/YcfS/YnhG family)